MKKLYLHLYGEEAEQTVLDWDQPLKAFDGKTGADMAVEAFALHVSQKGMGAGKGSTGNEIIDFVYYDYCFFHDQSLLIVTTAQASQPSPLPTNPSLSVVVAFTLTASRPTPIMGARVARIESI